MKLHFKTRPWPHQVRVLKRMVRQRGGGVQVPMRWGKSWVGINWAASLYHLEDVRRVLVVTVTSGLGVWEGQINEHCPVPYRIYTHQGECVEVYDAGPHLEFMIVNFQNVFARAYPDPDRPREWVPVANRTLKKFKPQAIIVDESHHIGDPTTTTAKHLYQLSRGVRFRLFMTGTMFHRKPFYVFGQVRFYDDGKTFGTAWGQFKKRIGIFGGYMGYEIKGYRNLKWMMDEVRNFTHIEKYVPRRPAVHNKIQFPLEGKNLEAYQAMEYDRVLRLDELQVLTADIVLTQHLRLLQIAGGFVKADDGYRQVGDSKLLILEDRLREYLEQDITKAVIGCRFIPELMAIAILAKKLGFIPVTFHGGLNKTKRQQRIQFFQKTNKPCLFISQISAGKESIDLSATSVMLFYSLTESYVEFDQFTRRIEKYKEDRTLMYDFLLARGTRDVVTYDAMQLKMDVAEYLVTDPNWVERLVAGRRR